MATEDLTSRTATDGATPARPDDAGGPGPAATSLDDRTEDAVVEPDPDAPAIDVVVEPVGPAPVPTADGDAAATDVVAAVHGGATAGPDPGAVTRGLAAESIAADNPTGWFEQLYVAASRGEAVVPWDRAAPSVLLVEWAETQGLAGDGRRALVVGCGLGRDAEYVASLGFDTVAFDISATAIRTARERHAGSAVDYVTANLLDPPAAWRGAYDLVVEDMNIQSLPEAVRGPAITNTAGFVAPGGTLVVVALAPYSDHEPEPGPPWPLLRAEIDALGAGELCESRIENIADATDPTVHRWRAEFHRPS